MLTIRLLGEMAVLRRAEALALPPSKKTRALLAYLVATGRPQRRERLCSLLWEVPDDPRGALRWSLSKLRALVDEPEGGPARILADREAVAFAAHGAACDLHDLRALAARPEALAAVPTDRLCAVAGAVGGEFLEGLDLPAQPDFQAWCVAEREDARRQHAAVLGALVARLSADGAAEEALPHARRLVGLDGFDARSRAALVGLLARAGRREEAEQHLEAGTRLLREAGLPDEDLVRAGRDLRAARARGRGAPARTDVEADAGSAPAPVTSADTAPDRAHSGGERAARIGRIVVVDDEPELGRMVAEYLARHGFAVRTAAGGGELDALLAAEPADLVVLDVNMPGEDGFAVARRLGARGGPPVLFLTADNDVVDRVAGLELGAVDYVTKPFDLRELRARVRAALRRTETAPPRAAAATPEGARPPPGDGAKTRAEPDGAAGPDEGAESDPRQEIRFCLSADGVRIAYATSGEGPPLLKPANWMTHLEHDWRSPVWRHWMRELSRGRRLVRYDERGNGLSDWQAEDLSFEACKRDLEAVVEAEGLRRFPMLGISQGCAFAVAYAVEHPERVTRLVLYGGYARGWARRGDSAQAATRAALGTLMRHGWGADNPAFRQMFTSLFVPDGTPEQARWFNELQRATASPENAVRLHEVFGQVQVEALLPRVRVPTLVLHCVGDSVVPFEEGRRLATAIPSARFVPLEGRNHILLEGEPAWGRFLAEVQDFLDADGPTHQAMPPSLPLEGSAPWRAEASRGDAGALRPAIGLSRVAPAAGTGAQPAAAAAFDPSRSSVPPAPPERKRVTVLAATLAEADEDAPDPELSMRRLEPCLEAIRDAVHRHDGRVTAMQADGVTAVFGAPVAHEDDAVSACLAALAMQDALRGGGCPGVALRVGLHTGEAVVRPAGGAGRPDGVEAVGPVMRTAGRAAARAAPGAAVLTDETLRWAEGFVNVAPLGDESSSGQGTVRLYSLIGRAASRSRWDVRAARGLTRFHGREAEMESLGRALRRAEAGRGEVVAVVGEPGVGKSRLAHEFLDAVVPPDWAVLLTGATPQDAGAAYLPIGGLLRSWLGVSGRETRQEVAAKLEDRVEARHPILASHRPALSALLDLPVEDEAWRTLSPGGRRRAAHEALRAVLAWESRRQPLVVLFEDLHWADTQTVAALDALVDRIGGLRILVVVTQRPEHRHNWAGKGCFSQLRLDPLPADAAEALLRSLLGDAAGLRTLRRGLAARTEGVPLFLEEAVRALADAGALSGAPGDYRLAAPDVVPELPSTVQAVLAARIDRLPPPAKALLQTASVIGREVPLLLLRRVCGLGDEALLDTLAELQAAEFLFETRMPPDLEYAFKHAMTQEAAYGGVLRERRRALHVEILRAIEEEYRDRLGEQVDRLAHHALAGELWEEAVRYLLRAANRAIERSAHPQAAELLRQGLDAMRHLPETTERLRAELDYRKALGVTMMALKGWGAQEVSDAYVRARELSERLGDERELFVALRGQGQFHMIRGELRTARALGERCSTLAACNHDTGVAIETHHLFWSNSFFMGDYADAEEHARHGVEMYDRDRDHHLTYTYSGHDPGVCCRCFSGLMLWQRGFADGALARCREALALAERLGHPLTLALACWAMSYVHLFRREPAEARHWAEREIAVCEDYLLPLLLSAGAFQLGWALSEEGDPEAGIARMRQGLAGVSATGAEMGLPYFVALLGEARAKAGRPDEGLAEMDRALAMADRNGARFQAPEVLRLKGELLLRLPEPDEGAAEACFHAALAAARAQGARLPELRALTSLARLPRARSEGAAAREALASAYGRFTEGFDTPDLRDARALLDA